MAGTRLRIVSVFLVSLLVWLTFSIRASRLHRDDLFQRQLRRPVVRWWRWLWQQQQQPTFRRRGETRGWSRCSTHSPPDDDDDDDQRLESWTAVFAVTVATADETERDRWRTVLLRSESEVNHNYDDDDDDWMTVVNANDPLLFHEICANPFALLLSDDNDDDESSLAARFTSLFGSQSSLPQSLHRHHHRQRSIHGPPDLWICPPPHRNTTTNSNTTHHSDDATTRVVWVPLSTHVTTTFLYPSLPASLHDDSDRREMPSILPRLPLLRSTVPSLSSSLASSSVWKVRLVLVMEPSLLDWKDTIQSVHEWIQWPAHHHSHGSDNHNNNDDTRETSAAISSIPCVQAMEYQVQRQELPVPPPVVLDSSTGTGNPHHITHDPLGTEDSNHPNQHRQLSIQDVQRSLRSIVTDTLDDSVLEFVVYVPATALHLVANHHHDNTTETTTSHSVAWDMNRYLYVVPTDQDGTADSATTLTWHLEATLQRIQDELWSRCFHMPTTTTGTTTTATDSSSSTIVNPIVPVTVETWNNHKIDDLMIPSVYQRLYFQKALRQSYRATWITLETARSLVESSAVYDHGPDLAAHFCAAQHWIAQAHAEAAWAANASSPVSFLQHVHRAQQWLEHAEAELYDTILVAPGTVEVMDFPPEQYAAIFAPLLFPLLIPVIVTLLREYQRYRKLVSSCTSAATITS